MHLRNYENVTCYKVSTYFHQLFTATTWPPAGRRLVTTNNRADIGKDPTCWRPLRRKSAFFFWIRAPESKIREKAHPWLNLTTNPIPQIRVS